MDHWAYCGTCRRWFYVERRLIADGTAPRCPVCDDVPVEIVARPSEPPPSDSEIILPEEEDAAAPPRGAQGPTARGKANGGYRQ
ncbi:MAG TPA: hypothetical protein VML96_11385 [Egibacteraceae bacterium]|nr:hypothetical protein [Egibacteraceae bacterium]